MIRTIGQSVMMQAVASAGNFVVSLLALHLLSLEEFGVYTLLFIVAMTAGSLCWSITGYVYSLYLPRYRRFSSSYAKQYNGFSFLVTGAVTAIAVLICLLISAELENLGFVTLTLFILAMIATDNVKVQASAEGHHGLVVLVEFVRQTAMIGAVAVLYWTHSATLNHFVLAQGVIGTASCSAIVMARGYRMSFRHLEWIARRHGAMARYFLPSTIISFFHASAIQFAAAGQFGAQAIGTLRAAELPYNAVNPLKLATNYFLPRLLSDFERSPTAGHRSLVIRAAAVATVAIASLMALIYAAALTLFPLLTGKDYPAALGAVWAVGYTAMFLLTIVNHYLSVLGRADLVLTTSLVGAAAAAVVYMATFLWVGVMAAALSIAASFIAMTAYGFARLLGHLSRIRPAALSHAAAAPSPA